MLFTDILLIPSDCITPELLQIQNGYGWTPLETLKAHLPTKSQLATLRDLGIAFDETHLTKERASGLIDAEYEKRKTSKTPKSLSYVIAQPSDSAITNGPPAKITLLAKSSSGRTPYKVEFMADGPSVMVYCHCRAGVQRWMCKHKLALILGDSTMLFDPGQTELLSQIQSWPQYSDLKIRTDNFENKLREIQEASAAEDSKFYNWLETRDTGQQTNPDEATSCIQIYMGIGDDDAEGQEKLAELNEAKDELKRKEKALKEDFMRGLTLGFHRI